MIPSFKKVVYPLIDAMLRQYGAWHSRTYDVSDTILVASTGRSGSTFVAQILSSLPGYHLIYEPFNLGSNPIARENGFNWNTYMTPGTRDPDKEEYLARILDGRELSTRTLNRHTIEPLTLLQLQGYVVKTINSMLMLRWICDCFPTKAVWLLRHPCAVVASQLRAGGWSWHEDKEVISIPDRLMKEYPHMQKVYDSLSSSEENLAFIWAMHNFLPFKKGGDFTTTTYEKIVSDRESEVDRLFAALNHPTPDAAIKQLSQESASGSSFEFERKDLLTDWKQRLSDSQIERILNVVHRMGVTCYTEAPHPNYNSLSTPAA